MTWSTFIASTRRRRGSSANNPRLATAFERSGLFERLEQRPEPSGEVIERKPRLQAVVPALPHSTPRLRILQKCNERATKRIRILCVDQHACRPILDYFACGVVRGAEAGNAVCHRLEVDEPK